MSFQRRKTLLAETWLVFPMFLQISLAVILMRSIRWYAYISVFFPSLLLRFWILTTLDGVNYVFFLCTFNLTLLALSYICFVYLGFAPSRPREEGSCRCWCNFYLTNLIKCDNFAPFFSSFFVAETIWSCLQD